MWIGRSHRGNGLGKAVLRQLIALARADAFDSLFVSTKPDNRAAQQLLAALDIGLVRDGETFTARVDLAVAE